MPLDSAFGEVSMAYGLNHYLVDKPLRDTLKYFMSREPELAGLGEFVGRELYELAYRVDRMSWPVHVMWSVRGRGATPCSSTLPCGRPSIGYYMSSGSTSPPTLVVAGTSISPV